MTSLKTHQFFETLPTFENFSWKDLVHVWEPLSSLKNAFEQFDLGRIEIDIPEGVWIDDPSIVSIGEGTIIEPGIYIKGPCVIGKNCVLRQGAYIREHVLIGDSCLIGHDSEVKHSILFDHVKAAHFAYIGDSIIGCNVNIGAGVICANFRFDKSEVPVFKETEKVMSGLKKLGAILSDNVQVGCNVVLNPGTIVGANSFIYPCVNAKGTIPANSFVKSDAGLSVKTPKKP